MLIRPRLNKIKETSRKRRRRIKLSKALGAADSLRCAFGQHSFKVNIGSISVLGHNRILRDVERCFVCDSYFWEGYEAGSFDELVRMTS